MKGKPKKPAQESKSGSSGTGTGNPSGVKHDPCVEKDPAKQRQLDEPEPLGHLRSIPFDQAREAFLLLLRETGRGDMEYVCRNVLRNVWDADVVRDKVEKRKL